MGCRKNPDKHGSVHFCVGREKHNNKDVRFRSFWRGLQKQNPTSTVPFIFAWAEKNITTKTSGSVHCCVGCRKNQKTPAGTSQLVARPRQAPIWIFHRCGLGAFGHLRAFGFSQPRGWILGQDPSGQRFHLKDPRNGNLSNSNGKDKQKENKKTGGLPAGCQALGCPLQLNGSRLWLADMPGLKGPGLPVDETCNRMFYTDGMGLNGFWLKFCWEGSAHFW